MLLQKDKMLTPPSRQRNGDTISYPMHQYRLGADVLESSSAERDWECWGMTG